VYNFARYISEGVQTVGVETMEGSGFTKVSSRKKEKPAMAIIESTISIE
jgi:hypothetical protein